MRSVDKSFVFTISLFTLKLLRNGDSVGLVFLLKITRDLKNVCVLRDPIGSLKELIYSRLSTFCGLVSGEKECVFEKRPLFFLFLTRQIRKMRSSFQIFYVTAI